MTIYALKREGHAAPYYIGQAVDVEKRRKQHGVKPSEIIDLEKVLAADAHATEREWVRRALALGIDLRNDHYNTARERTYPARPVVTFGPAPSGVIYCWLNIKKGSNTVEGYSLRCDTEKGDSASAWKAVSDMGQWLRDMGYPELAHRPQEWAQGRVERGKFPPEP
nr:GIY-YIG nuclease family protein [Armatimonas sp.]